MGRKGGEGEGWRRREVGRRTRKVHTTQRCRGEEEKGEWRGGKGVERRGGAVNRWEGAARLRVCGPKGLCVEVTGDSVV